MFKRLKEWSPLPQMLVIGLAVAAFLNYYFYHCEAKAPLMVYRFEDGQEVVCKHVGIEHCGVHLWDCEDGGHYYCQINVEELGEKVDGDGF